MKSKETFLSRESIEKNGYETFRCDCLYTSAGLKSLVSLIESNPATKKRLNAASFFGDYCSFFDF